MTTLEDKILGEKSHCYCSSSSGSENEEDSDEEVEKKELIVGNVNTESEPYKWEGTSSNTGPKGVIKDWQRFKQLEVERREEQEKERLELIKKLSITCENKVEEDPEIAELLDDGFLLQYQKQRMSEMLSRKGMPRFGKLLDLKNNNDFLDAIDKEHKAVTIIIHIYENNNSSCKCMNECLNSLAPFYPDVKFCKFICSSAGMSMRFKMGGVPALLIYKGGQVIGNFVRVTDDLGEEFYEGDVENFLIEHGMIVDRACVPSIVQS